MTGSGLLAVQAVIALGGVVTSLLGAAFLTGSRWGAVQQDIKAIEARLSRIEALFTLVMKNHE